MSAPAPRRNLDHPGSGVPRWSVSRTPDDGSGPLDVDAAFAEIVAHWGEDVPPAAGDGTRGGSTREDTGHPGEPDGAGTRPDDRPDASADAEGPAAAPGTGPARPEPRLVRPAAPLPPPPREDVPAPDRPATPRDEEPPELRAPGEDEGFVPAEPQPLPRDVLGWAAWAAVVGAPLFLLVVALGWKDAPRLITAIAAAVFVAGFATLVVRLPGSRDDDDDGAVV